MIYTINVALNMKKILPLTQPTPTPQTDPVPVGFWACKHMDIQCSTGKKWKK